MLVGFYTAYGQYIEQNKNMIPHIIKNNVEKFTSDDKEENKNLTPELIDNDYSVDLSANKQEAFTNDEDDDELLHGKCGN